MDLLSQRKKSYDYNSQSEEENSTMFAKISAKQISSAIQQLKQHYKPQIHWQELVNYCFRCHNSELVIAYDKFRCLNHPNLQQPAISNLFKNQNFVDLKQLGNRLSKQNFEIPGPHIPQASPNLKKILDDLFASNGYIPNLQRFLLFFPAYLEKHLELEKYLFQGDKIGDKIAYFLGLCGAAENGSAYMMCRFVKRFERAGGDMKWITQASYPSRFKLLLQLNRILSRAIWQVNDQMIEQFWQSSDGHWSKSQLALCIEILAFSHQNSTIALAIGLLPEELPFDEGLLNISKMLQQKSAYDMKQYECNNEKQGLDMLIPLIKQLQNIQEQDQQSYQKNSFQNKSKYPAIGSTPMSKKALKKSLRKGEAVDIYMKQIGNELSKQQMYQNINKWVHPLLPPFTIIEKRNQKFHQPIEYSDFNFKFNAYPILHNLTQNIADKFKNLIEYSEVMTRQNVGNQKLSTKQFRKALRFYAENLCGYRHSEYDFKSTVTQFLTMSLKFYIRLLMLSPIHINYQTIRQIGYGGDQIQCFDLGHIAVLIANTKMSLVLTLAILAFDA